MASPGGGQQQEGGDGKGRQIGNFKPGSLDLFIFPKGKIVDACCFKQEFLKELYTKSG